jgi:hypothetical protein
MKDWMMDFGAYEEIVVERMEWCEREPAKVKLDQARDSEPAEVLPFPKRGRKPMFGRAMTRAELSARYRYFKNEESSGAENVE